MKIIALDPGGTTGVAIFERARDTGEVTWRQLQLGPEEHHLALWDLLREERANVIIYERFMYQRRELEDGVSLVLVSLEYIGIVKLCWDYLSCQGSYEPELIEQGPHMMKLWGGGQQGDGGIKLKKVGLYKANARHANDATRHLLYYLSVTLGDKKWFNALRD